PRPAPLPLHDALPICSVVWRQNLGSVSLGCAPTPDNIMGITSAAVIDRSAGLVYQAGGDGQVYALDLATGAVKPGWPVRITSSPDRKSTRLNSSHQII